MMDRPRNAQSLLKTFSVFFNRKLASGLMSVVKKSKRTDAKTPTLAGAKKEEKKGKRKESREDANEKLDQGCVKVEKVEKVRKRSIPSREEKSKKAEGKKDEKKDAKKRSKSKSREKTKSIVPVDSPALINKKKFCKKFFVDELDGKKLMRDFVALRAPTTCVADVMKKHPDKCRYFDIMCADATRVVLLDRPPDNDFIHANWMTMPDKFRYISAQGPMDETLEDFWHMIYTERASAIVMICDWIENGIEKCSRYIPVEGSKSENFGIYTVTRTDQATVSFNEVDVQSFEVLVRDKPESPSHIVKHYHFRNWHDHTAPLSSISVLKVLKALRDPTKPGPPVIHCSAGIGRTATFIGVDYGNQRIGEVGEQLDVLDLVREMRVMRDKAVQSHHQFIFMLICVADMMVLEGVPRNDDMIDLHDFYKEFMEAAKKKRMKEEKKKKDAELTKKEQENKDKPEAEKSCCGNKKKEKSTSLSPTQ